MGFLPRLSTRWPLSAPLPRWAGQSVFWSCCSSPSLALSFCWVILELVGHCHTWFWMCCYWNWAFSYVVTESKTFSYLHCKPSTIIQLCSVTIVPHFRDICLRAYGSRSTGHFRKPLLGPTLIVLVPRDYDLSRLRIPCLKVSSVECFTWFF